MTEEAPKKRSILAPVGICLGLILLIIAASLSWRVYTGQEDQIQSKDEQIEILRGRVVAAELRADHAENRAEVERANQRRLICEQIEKINGFTSLIAGLIAGNPDLTQEQRDQLSVYSTPTEPPVTCP